MTTLSNNKTLAIHAACEVIALGIVVFWFQSRLNKIWSAIDEMKQVIQAQQEQLVEQAELLMQHDEALKKVYAVLSGSVESQVETEPELPKVPVQKPKRKPKHQYVSNPKPTTKPGVKPKHPQYFVKSNPISAPGPNPELEHSANDDLIEGFDQNIDMGATDVNVLDDIDDDAVSDHIATKSEMDAILQEEFEQLGLLNAEDNTIDNKDTQSSEQQHDQDEDTEKN